MHATQGTLTEGQGKKKRKRKESAWISRWDDDYNDDEDGGNGPYTLLIEKIKKKTIFIEGNKHQKLY